MKILFQGDSITDMGRDRNDCHNMGNGYPKFASAMIEDAFPEENFEFINLGCGGDRTENLVKRLETDFIDIQPDIVSILVGINDVWHFFSHGIDTPDEYFESNYRKVLSSIREKTKAKILIIEPFLLYVEDKAHMIPFLDRKIQIIRRLAREYADVYIPMDGIYAAACIKDKPTYFAADGVHPTDEGARLLAEEYLKAVTPLIELTISEQE